MYCLILLGLVASVSANVYQNAQCPLVKPVENFNLEAYGNGVWFEIARYPNDAEQGAQCGSTEYSLQGDVIQIKSYQVTNGRLASIEGSARLALPSTSQGKLIYSLPYGGEATATVERLSRLYRPHAPRGRKSTPEMLTAVRNALSQLQGEPAPPAPPTASHSAPSSPEPG